MTHDIRTLVLVLSVLCCGLLAPMRVTAQDSPSAESSALRSASYDGLWTGATRCLYDPGLVSENECDIGLTVNILGDTFQVQQTLRNIRGGETKLDLNSPRVLFMRLATNAVATAIDSGNDEDGSWVETWSFVMTLKSPDKMIVHWTRVVNNMDMPVDLKASKFSAAGMGELNRAR
jgi:hypothetical protein